MNLNFLLVLLGISGLVEAQPNYFFASGRVEDAVTHQPLQAASVFAQHTTIGMSTDAAGNFKLPLPNGGYDLVVSFTGYETSTRRISSSDAGNDQLVISLNQQTQTMEAVAVKASNEVKNGWEQYGDFFKDQFIGKSANSRNCILRNPQVLHFYYSKKRNRLKVLADSPVVVENRALGYLIRYMLDSLTYDYTTQNSMYTGYPYFEELVPEDSIRHSSWQAHRKKAYLGSVLHFMRCVYQKQLKEAGFEIQFIVKNHDADTSIRLGNFYGALNYSMNDSLHVVDIQPNQPEMAVIYNREKPDEAFTGLDGFPLKDYQVSVLSFNPAEPISIEQNGFHYNQQDISFEGYLSWEKLADMVPYDYQPPQQP